MTLRNRAEDRRVCLVVGPAGSGKTTFLSVLLHEVRHRLGAELDIAMLPSDDRTIAEVGERYERFVYDDKRVPPNAARLPGEQPSPLVHRLSRGRGRDRRTLTLELRDTSIEELSVEGSTDSPAVDAVVALVDPHDLPGSGLPSSRGRRTDSQEVLERVLDRLHPPPGRTARHVRIRIPVAVAVTKLDLLLPGLPPASPLYLRRTPGPRFDPVDRSAVDTETRARLASWGAGDLDRRLRLACADHQLFAVSALGGAPRDGLIPPGGPRPHRVEDPLLWLLHRFGFLEREGHR
jgi:GTPase SAR1 family protein